MDDSEDEFERNLRDEAAMNAEMEGEMDDVEMDLFGEHEQPVENEGGDGSDGNEGNEGNGGGAGNNAWANLNLGLIEQIDDDHQGMEFQGQPQFGQEGGGGEGGHNADARSDAGLSDDRSASEPSWEGFNESLLREPAVAHPMLLSQDELWKSIDQDGATEMRPKRAMRINIPVDFYKRDAEFFHQWQLPTGCESRCRATAALVSLLFAGMQMGFPSGKHEEKMRQQVQNEELEQQGGGRGAGKAKSQSFTHAKRYTYAPHDDETDSWPMFQIGLEDIYNYNMTEVVALGVWLFIFDENHSTSALVSRVMENTNNLKAAKSVTSASAASRNKDASAEADRHGKAGFGLAQIRDNFEGTVGLQYHNIATMEDWKRMLDLHSGTTSASGGRPCVRDLSKHINCAAGRRRLEGDSKTGCGGRHPMAPEWMFNAKRREALEAGLVHLDGSDMDVCEDQVNPSCYFMHDGHFCVPQLGVPCFWVCSSVEKKTIFDLPLTRPLQGTVTPGESLMKLFLEQEARQRNIEAGEPNRRVMLSQLKVDRNAANRLRSLATGRDEHQRKQDALLRNTLIGYDTMSSAALGSSDIQSNGDGEDGQGSYTIKTTPMNRRIARETDRIFTKLVQPWVSRQEAKFSAIAKPLQEEGVPEDDPRWNAYFDARERFHERFYAVKKDLVQYHLRLLRTCFMSSKDAATLPAGHKAMNRGLEEGVRDHGGSASIAWNGGKQCAGRQLMASDRQVWGATQEWLRGVFVDCCKIKGRDRRLMDEIYLHIFEMYTNQTFPLIICSEKGKGKSVRAMRMGNILPPGWVTFNSANTERSGMNGNNAPSNGTTVVCDEMIADLTPERATPRMEYWKQIVGYSRSFSIERTMSKKNADGTESHVTFKVETPHEETHLICTNLGQCFTAGTQDPDPGKEAMIQRTVCLQARAEADADSPEADFKANLKHPEVAPMISDFRLFTSLIGFVRMAIRDLDWLQPDFAIAREIFKEGDRMLVEEYGKPKPEPRRLVKRDMNLTTECVKEAVARVFFWKQTSVAYEAGRPNAQGRGKAFEIGDLWDVIRTLRPTREMILAAWSHSLEYSIGTSSHGSNVMTAICEKLGLMIDYFFKKLPTRKVDNASDDDDMVHSSMFEYENYLSELRKHVPGGSSGSDGVGALKSTLDAYKAQLREARILRCDFRRQAVDKPQVAQPMEAISRVVGEANAVKYSDALFPTAVTAAMNYKPRTLLQWATGELVPREDVNQTRGGRLTFKEAESAGGAKTFDFGWLVLYNTGSSERCPSWQSCFKERMRDAHSVTMFDMHASGVADAMYMLASSENAQLLAEQPQLPWEFRGAAAFRDAGGNRMSKDSVTVGPSPVPMKNALTGELTYVEAHTGDVLPVRLSDGQNHADKTPLHKQLDRLHQNCRLPSLQPHTSTKITRGAPLRRSDGAIEVNAVAAFEHVAALMECIVVLGTDVPGLEGLQERMQSKVAPPACLKAPDTTSPLTPDLAEAVRVLPYSIDLFQMAWSLDLANRFYSPGREEVLDAFNSMLHAEGLGADIVDSELPEMTLRYSGFPKSSSSETEALRLISAKIKNARPAGQKEVDIATSSGIQDIDQELLRYETELAIGGPANEADIEEHRRSLIGAGYVWGCNGDVFSLDTWADHLTASMLGRGNTDGKTDANGKYLDKAHVSILDAEFMLEARALERRCQTDESLAHLNIVPAHGTTYSFEKASRLSQTSTNQGQKRKRPEEAPRVRRSSSSLMQKQYAPTPTAAAAGPSRSGRVEFHDGDSRFE